MNNELKTINTKKNKWKLPLAVLFIILLLLTVGIINKTDKNGKLVQTDTPQKNTFYLATYQDTPILFYRYPHMMTLETENPHIGHYVKYEQAATHRRDKNAYIQFKELKNPRMLFSFEGLAEIENILLSEDKKYLIMSFVGGRADTTNYIYQIDLEHQVSKKIWEHEIRTGYPPYNGGIAHIIQFIPNQYAVFAIIKGNPPPTEPPIGIIIKNLKSEKESVLGIVGDIQINPNNNTVSYRSLEEKIVPCEGNKDPSCFAGDKLKKTYQPAGEKQTQPLPE